MPNNPVADPKAAQSPDPDQRKAAQTPKGCATGKPPKSSPIQYIVGQTGQVSQK